MAGNTQNLGLFYKEPIKDGNETFNIQTMLNDNWNKLDAILGVLSQNKLLADYITERLNSYVNTSEKGAANGVATLGEDSKVPESQLPDMDYVKSSEKGAANGVATLGRDGKVPTIQLPSVDSFRIELTSYTGSGTSGEIGKTSIGPFSFEPKIVFVSSQTTTAFFPIWRTSGTKRQTIVHFPYEVSITPGDNNSYHIPISYYIARKNNKYYLYAFNALDGADAADFQFNDSTKVYTAIAIG